jgi:hypothetical protein
LPIDNLDPAKRSSYSERPELMARTDKGLGFALCGAALN